jgi:hypothetical protein
VSALISSWTCCEAAFANALDVGLDPFQCFGCGSVSHVDRLPVTPTQIVEIAGYDVQPFAASSRCVNSQLLSIAFI